MVRLWPDFNEWKNEHDNWNYRDATLNAVWHIGYYVKESEVEKIIDLLQQDLEKEGFTTTVAYDGEQAINVALSVKPDLILLDLMLPKIDGFNIKYDRTDNFNLGISKIKTPFGNIVRAYDKERCICYLFLRSDYYDYEDRVYAINVYTKHYLNYKKLYSYAKKLNVYEEVKNVFEVIGWN